MEQQELYQGHFDERIERLETVKEIQQGLVDVKEGRTVSLEEFEARMQRKYGI